LRKWIVTFGGAGLAPIMPGTAGSLAAAGLLMLLHLAIRPINVWAWDGLLIVGVFLFSALCIKLGPFAVAHFGRDDPEPMVLDEAAGICLTLLFQPISSGRWMLATFAAAFVAFRIFDILKPPPARQLEHLPGGWGILLDDLAAAVYANVLCQLVLRLWLLRDLNHG
jgi:phosphatidylglycerophosphatase A